MATKECKKMVSSVQNMMNYIRKDKKYLINNEIYVHNRVLDRDLEAFCAKAINLTLDENLKPYQVILLNDKNVCFHNDNKFYLLPAYVQGVSIDEKGGQVLLDYPFKSTPSDFERIGDFNV